MIIGNAIVDFLSIRGYHVLILLKYFRNLGEIIGFMLILDGL